jgi:hypothetical protein
VLLSTGDSVYFGNVNLLDSIFKLSNPDLDGYDLTFPIGPLSMTAVLNPNYREYGALIPTTFGTMGFTSVSDTEFTADRTPEPASLGLLCAAAGLGLPSLLRKRS